MNILELPIKESKRRFDIREKELNDGVHRMNRSYLDEWIAKEDSKWITVDNTTGDFFVEEWDSKEDAIKRLETYDEDLLLNQFRKG